MFSNIDINDLDERTDKIDLEAATRFIEAGTGGTQRPLLAQCSPDCIWKMKINRIMFCSSHLVSGKKRKAPEGGSADEASQSKKSKPSHGNKSKR